MHTMKETNGLQSNGHHRNTQTSLNDDNQKASASTTTHNNSSQDYFENLRLSSTNVTRVGNVDVITTPNNNNVDEGFKELAFCHMAFFAPFSDEVGALWNAVNMLAVRHLNNGDGTVIKEIEGLDKQCNVRFTSEMFATELSEKKAVRQVIDTIYRDPGKAEQLPCVFMGAFRSAVSLPMSVITSLEGYPQFSPASTSTELDDKDQHKLFGRLIPSDDGTSVPAILYYVKKLKVQHLAVVHTNDAYGNAYARSLLSAAARLAPETRIQLIDIPYHTVTDEDISTAVNFLESTQYRYFFCIAFPKHFEPLMTAAYTKGIAGPGHFWMFSDGINIGEIAGKEVNKGSPLDAAIKGASILSTAVGSPGIGVYDQFTNAWKGLNNENDIKYLQSRQPKRDGASNYVQKNVEEQFLASDPGPWAAYVYDSTIAMGIAACNAVNGSSYFDGAAFYNSALNSTFEGTTGKIQLDPVTGTRDPTTVRYQLTNFVETNSSGTGKVTYAAVASDMFEQGEWVSLEPYVYADGTTIAPPSIPPLTTDNQYLGWGLRSAGLAMSATILILSIGFAVWTHRNRNIRVVKASQPIFLYIICVGTFIMGSTIIPLSLDDEIINDEGCSVACMASPWLLFTGFAIAFSGLFSKTWRANRIFNNPTLKRVQVTPKDVMKPLIALLGLNMIILALWTGISPLEWTREISSIDAFGRTVESWGHCVSFASSAPYLCSLLAINAAGLIFALYQTYLARNIPSEFAETKFIAMAMGAMLLVACNSIPIMIIAADNPKAYYFVLSVVIFVICGSLLLFIFLPKVRASLQKQATTAARFVRQSMVASTTSATRFGGSSLNESDSETKISSLHRDKQLLIARVMELEDLLENNERPKESKETVQPNTDCSGAGSGAVCSESNNLEAILSSRRESERFHDISTNIEGDRYSRRCSCPVHPSSKDLVAFSNDFQEKDDIGEENVIQDTVNSGTDSDIIQSESNNLKAILSNSRRGSDPFGAKSKRVSAGAKRLEATLLKLSKHEEDESMDISDTWRENQCDGGDEIDL